MLFSFLINEYTCPVSILLCKYFIHMYFSCDMLLLCKYSSDVLDFFQSIPFDNNLIERVNNTSAIVIEQKHVLNSSK